MVVTAYYPDGRTEILLSVPNYDFNWQTSYDFQEPKFIPAGTTLIQHQWWDNSAQNKANPDPTIEVTWGDQSFEEMLFGAYMMRVLQEEEIRSKRFMFNFSKLDFYNKEFLPPGEPSSCKLQITSLQRTDHPK